MHNSQPDTSGRAVRREIDLLGPAIRWEGALDLEATPDGVVPCRVRLADASLLDETLVARAKVPSGVRLTTITEACSLELRLTCIAAGGDAAIDLLIDGRMVATRHFPSGSPATIRFDGLPNRGKRVEVYLPTWEKTIIHGLSLDAEAACLPWHDARPRWITHGSSITACKRSTSPARSWPAIVARNNDWHLTNLGYGGQCLFDQVIARTIAKLPADFISLCLGINTYHSAFNPRTWKSAALGFILTVRDGHPETPLVILSPIISPPRETTAGSTGLALPFMRSTLAEIVECLSARGDRRIWYLNGLDIFGTADAALLPDQLHPDGAGIERMGERLAVQLGQTFFQ